MTDSSEKQQQSMHKPWSTHLKQDKQPKNRVQGLQTGQETFKMAATTSA